MSTPSFVFVIVDTPHSSRTGTPDLPETTLQAYRYEFATSIEETVAAHANDFPPHAELLVTTDARCDTYRMTVNLEAV